MRRPRPLAALALAALLVNLAAGTGCAAIAGAMTDEGGGVTMALMRGGFWTGAIAGAPVAAAALPLTLPLAAGIGDKDGLAIVAGPAILTGAVVGVACAAPGLLVEGPVLLVEAIGEALAGKPEPLPAMPASPPPPAPAARPADPPEAPLATAGAPPADALDRALALPDAPAPAAPVEPPPRTSCDEGCCHALAIAPLLPPHEHDVGLTQALFSALANPAAAAEARRALETRPDAVPLLLRGLSDPERGGAAAQVLIVRRGEPAVVPGLVDVALDPGAGKEAQGLAQGALREIERLTPPAAR